MKVWDSETIDQLSDEEKSERFIRDYNFLCDIYGIHIGTFYPDMYGAVVRDYKEKIYSINEIRESNYRSFRGRLMERIYSAKSSWWHDEKGGIANLIIGLGNSTDHLERQLESYKKYNLVDKSLKELVEELVEEAKGHKYYGKAWKD